MGGVTWRATAPRSWARLAWSMAQRVSLSWMPNMIGTLASGRIDCRAQQRGPLRLTQHRAFPERRRYLYRPPAVADPGVHHHLHHLAHGPQVDLQVLVERRRYRSDRPHYQLPQLFSVHRSSEKSRCSMRAEVYAPDRLLSILKMGAAASEAVPYGRTSRHGETQE